jgi:hypothetical protein
MIHHIRYVRHPRRRSSDGAIITAAHNGTTASVFECHHVTRAGYSLLAYLLYTCILAVLVQAHDRYSSCSGSRTDVRGGMCKYGKVTHNLHPIPCLSMASLWHLLLGTGKDRRCTPHAVGHMRNPTNCADSRALCSCVSCSPLRTQDLVNGTLMAPSRAKLPRAPPHTLLLADCEFLPFIKQKGRSV